MSINKEYYFIFKMRLKKVMIDRIQNVNNKKIKHNKIIFLLRHLLKSVNGRQPSHFDPFSSQEDDPVDSKASTPPAKEVDNR